MGRVTYIHTKTSLVTKYCNTTDQVIISGKTKRHLMQPPWPWAYLTSPHSHLTLSPSQPQPKPLKLHWAAQLSLQRREEGTVTHSVTCLGYMRNHGSANARVTLEMQVCFKKKKHIPVSPNPDFLPWLLCPRRAEQDNPGADACLLPSLKLTTWAQGWPGEGTIATTKNRGENTAPDHSKTAMSDIAHSKPETTIHILREREKSSAEKWLSCPGKRLSPHPHRYLKIHVDLALWDMV